MKRCRFLQQTTVIQNAVGERNQSKTCTEITHTHSESLEMNARGGPSSGWPITIDLYLQGNLKHEYLHQNTPEPRVNVREVLAATREKAESRDPVLKSNFRGNTCQLEIDLKLFFQLGKNPFHLLDAPEWHLVVGSKQAQWSQGHMWSPLCGAPSQHCFRFALIWKLKMAMISRRPWCWRQFLVKGAPSHFLFMFHWPMQPKNWWRFNVLL